ncbi:hypothetical protein M422DRAFT_252312 [Sphaerobolus stellatus SS14]|uniref:Uncharacterized protein n=1 Tax=Sphaerobolus stellatus (strain SS14) TaxID=990650 RepID=A0A0C9VZ11_SPHS4|nr:hypothetical protein M422DRAFT_252312 [Sphaerobolus stellatus SS14]
MVETSTSVVVPHRGILRIKSTSDVSVASEESSKIPNITFAPLPSMETRKRRNNRPIGLAGRAEMLRRSRRPMLIQQDSYEEEEYTPQREEEDIALPDLGKIVKGLWKSVSRRKKGRSFEGSLETRTGPQVDEDRDEEEGEGGVWIESVGSKWGERSGFDPQIKLPVLEAEEGLDIPIQATKTNEKPLQEQEVP